MGQLAPAHLPTRFLRLANCNTTEAQHKRRRWADGRPTLTFSQRRANHVNSIHMHTFSQRRANHVNFTLGDRMGRLAAAHLPTRFLLFNNYKTTEAQQKHRRWAEGRPTTLCYWGRSRFGARGSELCKSCNSSG